MKLHTHAGNSRRLRLVSPMLGMVALALSVFKLVAFADPPPAPEEDTDTDPPSIGSGQFSAQSVISAPFGTSFQVNVSTNGQNIVGDAAKIRKGYIDKLDKTLSYYKRECLKEDIDYVLIDTNQPLDGALYTYLKRRQGKIRN